MTGWVTGSGSKDQDDTGEDDWSVSLSEIKKFNLVNYET